MSPTRSEARAEECVGHARGLHVAIIMDGSGRWATRKGLPRTAGHHAGLEAVRRTVGGALDRGIGDLTLFAFSSDNWQRPSGEVATLLEIFTGFLTTHAPVCRERGIRLSVIGRRDRIGGRLRGAVEAAEDATRGGTALHLRLAIDYSGRDAIVGAARTWLRMHERPGDDTGISEPDRVELSMSRGPEAMRGRDVLGFRPSRGSDGADPLPDVDLLIRTGGERRLSDFLLWECAYAEILFLDRMWPDFGPSDLLLALSDFSHRERRFGRIVDVKARLAP